MRKRAFQAALIFCAVITSLTLWARQQGAGTSLSPAQIDSRVEHFLRQFYAWGKAYQIKAAPPESSPIPGLYVVPVSVSYKGQNDHAIVYVSQDGHYLFRGTIDSLLGNPYSANLQKLDIANHPYAGPAKACVNVVEFSDFQCPHCREAHQDLLQIKPQYPQVRFTFMDFPLTEIHPWAKTAAIAGRCAYQQNPSAYAKFQNLVFQNQDQITPTNAFNKLGALATQAGLNGTTLQTCISSPETTKLVDEDIDLGKQLHVNSTPTFFVNGRPMVGWNTQLFEQFVTYELEQCQRAH